MAVQLRFVAEISRNITGIYQENYYTRTSGTLVKYVTDGGRVIIFLIFHKIRYELMKYVWRLS